MQLAITSTSMNLSERAPVVFRGEDEWCLKQIRSIGYDGVEMHIHDSAGYDREKLKRRLRDNELLLTSIGTGSAYNKDHIFLCSNDPGIRNAAVKRLRDHMITASDYPHAVVIIGLVKGKISDCSSREEYFSNLISALQQCAAYAEKYEVYLGLEVVNRYESDAVNTISQGIELLDQVGSTHIQLHLDTYHMNIEEKNIMEAIRQAEGRICHVHMADNDRWYVGHGHYNFSETVQALKSVNYPHALCVETLGLPDMLSSARSSYLEMKRLVNCQ